MSTRSLMLAALLAAVSCPLEADDLPWAFNAPRADGYAIDLVDIQPAPGTPLVAGASVEFRVKVKYAMSIASHGSIVLVFQDEKNRSASSTAGQVKQGVDAPGGEAALSETIIVPVGARELRLFIPLVPDGLVNTTGEVTIRYPIRKR